jgi:uncharacterized protein
MKIIIAGGTGFLGSHLSQFFKKRGDEVLILSRHPRSAEALYWNPQREELNPGSLENIDVVINLSGESILGRWSKEKLKRIEESRLGAARFLCKRIEEMATLPKLYLGASAIGYYGHRPREIVTEKSEVGSGWMATLCVEWENIPKRLEEKGVRVVAARIGIVMGSEGGALKRMAKAIKWGGGLILGDGSQLISWIAIDDLAHAIAHTIEKQELKGPVNFVSPHPLTMEELTLQIAHHLKRPKLFYLPPFLLNWALKGGESPLLASVSAQPEKLLHSGYQFLFPTLESVIKKYLQINP